MSRALKEVRVSPVGVWNQAQEVESCLVSSGNNKEVPGLEWSEPAGREGPGEVVGHTV